MDKEFINLMIVISIVSLPLLTISIAKFIQGDYINSMFAINFVMIMFASSSISYTITKYLLKKEREKDEN